MFDNKIKNLDIKIAPSILAADWSNINSEIEIIRRNSELIHIDIMDNIFVPNKTFNADFVKSIKTDIPLDVHLMVNEPTIEYIKDFIDAGVKIISIHFEAFKDKNYINELLIFIKSHNIKPSIAIKPQTDINLIIEFLPLVDMILIMTVEPGFGGQKFIADIIPKIEMMRKLAPDKDIEVDGGINCETIKLARNAGANIFVVGSAIFKKKDMNRAILNLKEILKYD